MITIKAHRNERLRLGKVGEFGVRRIEFDLRHFEAELGDGVVTILRRRPGDDEAYPVVALKEGNYWYWTIALEDTAYAGYGEAEVVYTPSDGGLARSETYQTIVEESLYESSSDIPEAHQGWVDHVLTETAKALSANSNPPKLSATLTWLVWDPELSEYVDSGVEAVGPNGDIWTELDARIKELEQDISYQPINAAAHGLVEGSENFENNSAVLQALVEQFAGDFTILIPAGIYIFTTPITVPDGATVEIVGGADAFANSMNRENVGGEYHAKANGTTVIYRGEGAMFRHQGCVFTFRDLSLVSQDADKNYLYTARLVGQTVVDSGTKGKIYAENCLFAGWKTVAGDPYVTDELEAAMVEKLGEDVYTALTKPATLEQCCIVASRCRFSFCGCAVNMMVDGRLDDCSINKCYYGASFYGSAGFTTLAQCRIEWCIYDGVIAKQAHDVLVTGCEFDRCGHAAVRYVSCTGSSVIGNTMRRSGADASLTANAATRNTHLYINGCTGGVVSANTTVRKNISDDGSSSVVRPVNAYNIQLNSGMVIAGNDFNGCTTGNYNRFTDNTDCEVFCNKGLSDTSIDSYVAAAIEAYMTEHPVEITVDTTLTQPGQAADAAAVGALAADVGLAFNELAQRVEELHAGTTLLEEQTLAFAASDVEGNYGHLTENSTFFLTAGSTYRILWDGAEYTCVAYVDGSAVLVGDDTTPFQIATMESAGWLVIATADEGATHAVGIYLLDTAGAVLPAVTTDDNGKLLQVVDGVWTAVALSDSSIAAYIDGYIGDALGGEY